MRPSNAVSHKAPDNLSVRLYRMRLLDIRLMYQTLRIETERFGIGNDVNLISAALYWGKRKHRVRRSKRRHFGKNAALCSELHIIIIALQKVRSLIFCVYAKYGFI